MHLRRFRFPGLVALIAGVVYLATLSGGTMLGSRSLLLKTAGWDFTPTTTNPVTWLLLLPAHLLPPAWLPLILNGLAALLAAGVLGLLARCGELLPWDVPPKARNHFLLRLPILLGIGVAGLELSFWQEATAFSGEMVGLSLFVAALWCLLEYRDEPQPRWLTAAVALWGVGMAENWAMILLLPLFCLLILAQQRLAFFAKRNLLRLGLAGLAGFSVILLLPLVNGLNPNSGLSLAGGFAALGEEIRAWGHLVYRVCWSWHRQATIAVLLCYCLPILACLVRLKQEGAVSVAAADILQLRLFRSLRLVLLLGCLWLAFEPTVGPQLLMQNQVGSNFPCLTLIALNALAITYLAGSLYYASQIVARHRPASLLDQGRKWAPWLLGGMLVVTLGLLTARNLPALRPAGRPPLEWYGRLVVNSLPAGGGILIGSGDGRLAAVQLALWHRADGRQWAVTDPHWLADPHWRADLEKQTRFGWNQTAAGEGLSVLGIAELIHQLSARHPLYALDGHHGEILPELFNAVPTGGVHVLQPWPGKELIFPQLSAAQIATNEMFWEDAWNERLAPLTKVARPHPAQRFLKRRLGLVPVVLDQNKTLRAWFSADLNDWGVQLQQNDQWPSAQHRFEQALLLNSNNVAAAYNLGICTNFLAGHRPGVETIPQITRRLQNLQQIVQLIHNGGEIDDPGMHCVIAEACIMAGLSRQAWLEFERARILAPTTLPPQLGQAEVYLNCRFTARTHAAIAALRPQVSDTPEGKQLDLNLSLLEARCWMTETNQTRANEVLQALLERHPEDSQFANTVFGAYLNFGEAQNAMDLLEKELSKTPDNISALQYKAALLLQLHQATNALPVIDHALSLTNLPGLHLSRAMALLELADYPGASQEYATLAEAEVDKYAYHWGLALVAVHNQNTNDALDHLEACLANCPPGSTRWQEARRRLNTLQP